MKATWMMMLLAATLVACSDDDAPKADAAVKPDGALVDGAGADSDGASDAAGDVATADSASGDVRGPGSTPCERYAKLMPTHAPLVAQVKPYAQRPTPAGGALADGIYIDSAHTLYGDGVPPPGPNAPPNAHVNAVAIEGSDWVLAQWQIPTKALIISGGTFAVSGTDITFTRTCGRFQAPVGGRPTAANGYKVTGLIVSATASKIVFGSTTGPPPSPDGGAASDGGTDGGSKIPVTMATVDYTRR